MGATKNLGQVAGVHIGSTPPDNVILIWYDNTPSQQRHKVYDPTLKQWVVLDQTTISAITYSELVNMAKNTGLSVGEWFQITDRSNALALAITSTKVQYSDTLGNILIDDLGTNIQYHVTSSNLSIDDVIGVFDAVNKKLVFQFNEVVPDMTADDFVLGKIQRNNVWSLAKYRLSSFLSKVTGNSISWNGGFFFNFSNAVKDILDKKGGVVAKDTYDSDMQTLNTSIQNVGKENQNIIKNAQDALDKATASEQFYATKSPALETEGEPTDAAKGDSLLTILSKLQKYITKFKYATGIRMSTDFTDVVQPEYVNNNDTVDSAIRKIQYWLKKLKTGNNIQVSSDTFPIQTERPTEIVKDDTITTALSKLWYLLKNINGSQLIDNIINFNKIAKSGVLPTDVFRVDLTTSFDFSGGALGGIMVQDYGNFFFSQDPAYPYNPYRIRLYYNSAFPKILAFVPVTPVLPNVTNQYSNAGSLVHYVEGDATLQAIFQISKSRYDSLYSAGNRYFKCVIQADVYNSLTDEQTIYISMEYVNILNITLRQASLNRGGQQHIIFKLSVTPTPDTNS